MNWVLQPKCFSMCSGEVGLLGLDKAPILP
jgi:hypothetical protein